MSLRRRLRDFCRAWHLLCRDVHRGIAAKRQWQASERLCSASHHLVKADQHESRAEDAEHEPTELDGGDKPFRSF